MRCLHCDREMVYDGYGNYKCEQCGRIINDLVYRYCKDYEFNINPQNPQFYQKGWICPKCGGVMSPNQLFCINCQPKNIEKIKVTYTGINPTSDLDNKSISKGE